MRRLLLIAMLGILALASACDLPSHKEAPAEKAKAAAETKAAPKDAAGEIDVWNGKKDDSDVVARVNGKPILLGDVRLVYEEAARQAPPGGAEKTRTYLLNLRKGVLDRAVDDLLVAGEVEALGLKATDAEVDETLQNIIGKKGSVEKLSANLKKAGRSLDQLKADLRRDLAARKYKDYISNRIVVSDEEARQAYEADKQRFNAKETVEASHILFNLPPPDKRTVEEEGKVKQKALKALAEIRSGKISFEKAVKKYSEDEASKKRGGWLGPVYSGRTQDPHFETLVLKLRKGQISDPILSSIGWHIVRCNDYRPGGQRSFDEVKDYLKRVILKQKRENAYKKKIEELRSRAKVEILP